MQLVLEELLLLEEVILLVFCLGDTGVGLLEALVEALDGVHLQADAIKENLGALCGGGSGLQVLTESMDFLEDGFERAGVGWGGLGEGG